MGQPDALTPEEWFQFVISVHALMLSFQNSCYLVREGTLDPEVHASITEAMIATKDQQGFIRFLAATTKYILQRISKLRG